MSPRLLFLLTTLRTHHRLERDRDRIDARPAATGWAFDRPSTCTCPDPVDLPIAA